MISRIDLFRILVINLLLVGCIGGVIRHTELSGIEMDSNRNQSLQTSQELREETINAEEMRTKIISIRSNYEEHTPIVIDGNPNFNDTAITEGWPGNGTVNNPFIIEGLNITGPSGNNLIDIKNTDVYFQINNSFLSGGYRAISLDKVENGLISNNSISNCNSTS